MFAFEVQRVGGFHLTSLTELCEFKHIMSHFHEFIFDSETTE